MHSKLYVKLFLHRTNITIWLWKKIATATSTLCVKCESLQCLHSLNKLTFSLFYYENWGNKKANTVKRIYIYVYVYINTPCPGSIWQNGAAVFDHSIYFLYAYLYSMHTETQTHLLLHFQLNCAWACAHERMYMYSLFNVYYKRTARQQLQTLYTFAKFSIQAKLHHCTLITLTKQPLADAQWNTKKTAKPKHPMRCVCISFSCPLHLSRFRLCDVPILLNIVNCLHVYVC